MKSVEMQRAELARVMIELSDESKSVPQRVAYLELQRRVDRGGQLKLRWRNTNIGFMSIDDFRTMVENLPPSMARWSSEIDARARLLNAQEQSLRAMSDALRQEGGHWLTQSSQTRADVLSASQRETQRKKFVDLSKSIDLG